MVLAAYEYVEVRLLRLAVYLKALACNVKRMVRARLDEMLVRPAALATAPTDA